MTNWMTAGGLALIAGGLATLISFRSLLFGGGERRARRREAIEAPPQRPALAAAPVEPEVEPVVEPLGEPQVEAEVEADAVVRRGRRGRRRALVPAEDARSVPFPAPDFVAEDRGGLASIGLAGEDEEGEFEPPARVRRGRRSLHPIDEILFDPPPLDLDEDPCAEADHDVIEEIPAPRSDRYGDRVEGWIRPEHHEPAGEPRPGEYWTPIPVDLNSDHEPSAKGYGWPQAVERLPAVPDYEPATGFDLRPVPAEPTEVVPVWAINDESPGRVRLPRSWAVRNEKPKPAPADRPSPRPRPRPSISEIETPIDRSTMYVSRHAADPPPRSS
ncbi:hypothetical protein BJ973_007949 [Actinoplanes tereljensis]|uniref:hypothetical protein n=1 Tax=Paractinoplanes tereljensis TaxID=571912 RepID=UPI001943706D|nr:hypothetical protein [Actinoplanes tereljensis]